MSAEESGAPLIVALELDDPALTERVMAALADLPGLRIASAGEVADVALVVPTSAERAGVDADRPLTAREHEVLLLLVEGASNKAIARRLGISVHTAKFHVARVLDKLDATGRTDAVAHALRHGVIDL